MMGLLDSLNSDEALMGMALLSAAAPKPVRTGIGEGLLQARQLVQAERMAREDRAIKQRMMALQEQQLMGQLQAQQAQQALGQRRDKFLGAIDANQGPPMQPTMAGAMLAGISPQEFAALTPQPQQPKRTKLAPGEAVFDDDTGKQLFGLPKEQSKPSDWQLYELSGAPGRGISFDQWDQARRRAGASNVSVPINMGQKGFDNTLKLRGDFRGEPVYKAHQEMQSAYSQITQALKASSPAGDLAAATKIMKLLDPGSVVRESELGMAMAATGLMDRVTNYADNIIKGTKLTAAQRKDFESLAASLYGESVKQYNAKRQEYQGIAERNGLNVPDVLGAESQMPAANGGWSIKPKGK